MKNLVILAGLPIAVHQHFRSMSSKKFVPNGELIRNPLRDAAYSVRYAAELAQAAYQFAAKENEAEEISIVLAYVRYAAEKTTPFVDCFFPYALPWPLDTFQPTSVTSKNALNRQMNAYADYVQSEIRKSISVGGTVRKYTHIHNLTPLLLPLHNFRSDELRGMMRSLFWNLSAAPDPEVLIKDQTEEFLRRHPRVKPGDEDRHCFSDGKMFFKSPGKNRHGFFRNSSESPHPPHCLLSARSRLGGTYDYTFHFDCEPTKGGLAAEYPNCHGLLCEPATDRHVNIAPNDYIIRARQKQNAGRDVRARR